MSIVMDETTEFKWTLTWRWIQFECIMLVLTNCHHEKRKVSCFTCMSKLVSFHCPLFSLFVKRVDIMFFANGIFTLANVVIVNPTQINLVWQTASSSRVAMAMVLHAKKRFYHSRHLSGSIFPLAIEVFGCLHQQANKFLCQCANMVWLAKGIGLPLDVLCVFYRQR